MVAGLYSHCTHTYPTFPPPAFSQLPSHLAFLLPQAPKLLNINGAISSRVPRTVEFLPRFGVLLWGSRASFLEDNAVAAGPAKLDEASFFVGSDIRVVYCSLSGKIVGSGWVCKRWCYSFGKRNRGRKMQGLVVSLSLCKNLFCKILAMRSSSERGMQSIKGIRRGTEHQNFCWF